jgi:TRAP-type C4-dicarboxylate transport system substrate-binding protein
MKFLTWLSILLAMTVSAEAGTVIKLGTIAPEGSVWHDALLEVHQRWRKISGGEVELRIYAGGVLGGEDEMVRKVQRRSLDAVAITGAGLPRFDDSVRVLNVPLLFDSFDELNYVRSRIAPKLESILERRGYKVLTWSDAGWAYFYTKTPVRTPDDLRKLRLWISSGLQKEEKLYKDFGVNVVPLPVTEMLTALQTGLVDAIDVPPLFALINRSYRSVGYMTDVRWGTINGAVVIRAGSWKRISPAYREQLQKAIRGIARSVQAKARQVGAQSIVEMQARGLKVVDVGPGVYDLWRREARKAYPALRASMAHPELFDEVLRLADEFKSGRRGSN